MLRRALDVPFSLLVGKGGAVSDVYMRPGLILRLHVLFATHSRFAGGRIIVRKIPQRLRRCLTIAALTLKVCWASRCMLEVHGELFRCSRNRRRGPFLSYRG